jgi:hypothetical protein
MSAWMGDNAVYDTLVLFTVLNLLQILWFHVGFNINMLIDIVVRIILVILFCVLDVKFVVLNLFRNDV